ncbi:phage tail tube protein [Halomonas smyrnensis]|uniref:phage tail tube protein n=1 Tax=Halomonas smyrnensis TaxID=720605 RepID=UPI00030C0BB2|nr:phage tail tube protein [Halomonas smyrnensis]
MAKKWRKRFAVAKIEAAYGQASADMTGATILEVVMLDGGNPYAGNTVERERMRDGLGAYEQVNTGPYVERQIRVPLSGAGTAGTAPAYGPLLRACGMSETINVDTDVVYQPVSDSQESLELWWMEDGQMQHISGARGTFSITADSQGLPYIEFNFTGLYKKTEAAGDASVAEQAVQENELPINKQNTVASIDSHQACMSSLSLDIGNTVEYRGLVNCESVQITDRQATGSTNIEAPDLTTKDYFAAVESHNGVTLVPVVLTHGQTAGNIIELKGDQVQLNSLSPTDNQGIMHYDIGLRFLPTGADDNDVTLTFK